MIGHSLNRYRDAGLLILRVGLGLSFMIHGFPKLLGGPALWQSLGQKAGFDFLPTFFGLAAGLTEFAGGLLLALGLLFRPTLFFLLLVMIGALVGHVRAGAGYALLSHPIEIGIVLLSFFLIGPGRFSADAELHKHRRVGF